jgi:hypothetical protein
MCTDTAANIEHLFRHNLEVVQKGSPPPPLGQVDDDIEIGDCEVIRRPIWHLEVMKTVMYVALDRVKDPVVVYPIPSEVVPRFQRL